MALEVPWLLLLLMALEVLWLLLLLKMGYIFS
jgi:hypothetical protein